MTLDPNSQPLPKKTDGPSFYIFEITPHEITESTFMWNFTIPFDQSYLPISVKDLKLSGNQYSENQESAFYIKKIH